MGAIKIRTISDMARLGANPKITCRSCGHAAVYERQGIIDLFRSKGWNDHLDVAGHRFRCRICGKKGAAIDTVVLDERKPAAMPKVLWEC